MLHWLLTTLSSRGSVAVGYVFTIRSILNWFVFYDLEYIMKMSVLLMTVYSNTHTEFNKFEIF